MKLYNKHTESRSGRKMVPISEIVEVCSRASGLKWLVGGFFYSLILQGINPMTEC